MAEEKRILFILAIISKWLPSGRNLQAVGRLDLPLLLTIPLAGRPTAEEERILFVVVIIAKWLPSGRYL